MIQITPSIAIDDKEIRLTFVRSSGPGGQNVNKVSTAVQLRFNAAESPSLPPDVRRRLIRLGGKRISADGVLIINAQRFRSQELNRQDAVERLVELISKALYKPKVRRRTKPTSSSVRLRLGEKSRRAAIKRLRSFSRNSSED